MSLRQLCVFIFAIGIIIFSFFITIQKTQAGVVGCNQTCGGSLTCGSLPMTCDPSTSKCRNASCTAETSCVCPLDVGGKVTYCGVGTPASGVTIAVNDTWGQQTRTTTTDANGNWVISQMAHTGDSYAVRVPSPPNNVPKTTETTWSWDYCVNPITSTNPWADTPAGSSSYECQKRMGNDCAGPNGSGVQNRCNFCLALPCPANLTATCTSSYLVNLSWTDIPGAASHMARVNNTSNNWHGDELTSTGCEDNPLRGCLGDRAFSSNTPANGIVITPGVPYKWSLQGVRASEPYPWTGCQQSGPDFTCACPAAQSCASLACHTGSQTVQNGDCTTTSCPSNAPPAVACPTTCGYAGGDVVPNGDCTNTTCPAVPDTLPPSVPAGTSVTFIPDVTCPNEYKVKYSWNTVTDDGCAGLHSAPYRAQVSKNPTIKTDGTGDFKSIDSGWTANDVWANTTSETSAIPYPPETVLWAHVRSRDAFGNQSAYSTAASITIPVPAAYPPIHIEGPIMEEVGGVCDSMTVTSRFKFSPSFSPSAGVSALCTVTGTGSTYACDITIDNRNGCVSPTVDVTMGGTYAGYDSIEWRDKNNCMPKGAQTITMSANGGDTLNIPLFLSYNPGTTGAWFKLKDSSFNSRQSNRENVIPYTISKFSSSDSDDSTSNHNIMIGSSGLLVQDGQLLLGENGLDVEGKPVYSQNSWYTSGYAQTNDIPYLKYIDYMKARKDFTPITAPLTNTSFPTSGIYSVSGDITLSDATFFNGKNIVLVVTDGGKAIFTGTDFKPTGSVAVLASEIDIDPTITEIDAILIGQNVLTGESATGLKIKGNLIDEGALQLNRAQSDPRRPSLFVVFDPKIYLDVLPYLSTSTYDWRQIQ